MLEMGWREVNQRGTSKGVVAPKRLRTTDLDETTKNEEKRKCHELK